MSSPRLSWHLFIYSRALQIRYAIIWRVTTERRDSPMVFVCESSSG